MHPEQCGGWRELTTRLRWNHVAYALAGLPGEATGWQRPWADYHAWGRDGGTPLPDAVTATTWERFFASDEPMEGLMAEMDGRLVGCAHIVFHNERLSRSDGMVLGVGRQFETLTDWKARHPIA